jgi:hypothetical protein
MDVVRLPKTDGPDAGDAPKSSAADADDGTPAGDPDRPQVVTSSPFNKGGDPILGISADARHQLVEFAFSAKDGDWMKEPLRADDGFLLVSLKDAKLATHDDFLKEKDTFEQTLLNGKRAEALALHVNRLRELAKDQIKIDESYIADLKGDGGVGQTDDDEEGP